MGMNRSQAAKARTRDWKSDEDKAEEMDFLRARAIEQAELEVNEAREDVEAAEDELSSARSHLARVERNLADLTRGDIGNV